MVAGVLGVLYEVLGASDEFPEEGVVFLLSAESWEGVVDLCEVVLRLVLVSVCLTGVPEFLVTLVLLVVDLQVVLLLGAEVEWLLSDAFVGSLAERPFRSFLWLLAFFSIGGVIS